MNKIGVVINSLYSSQLAYYAIRNINDNIRKDYLTNFIFFVKDLVVPCVEPECGVMRWEELWGFDSHVVTTDLEGTRKALLTPGPKSINYYMYDLEWARRGKMALTYEDYAGIYQNPQVKLIAKTEEYKKMTENIWNTKVAGVCNDFNLTQMLPIIGVGNENKHSDR